VVGEEERAPNYGVGKGARVSDGKGTVRECGSGWEQVGRAQERPGRAWCFISAAKAADSATPAFKMT
jgi:hypothetical protein